jgi:hypothetical protein
MGPVPLTVLLETSRVAAEVTVARLQALEIDAQVLDEPNVFTKLASGGNYRVRVAVPEEELERSRTELARWEEDARPRVEAMSRKMRLGFLLGSLPAVALLLWLLLRHEKNTGLWLAIVPAWLAGLMGWAFWDRRRRTRAEAKS